MSNSKQTTIEAMFEARAHILRIDKEIKLLEAKEKQAQQNIQEIEKIIKVSRYAGYVPRCEMKQSDVEELIEVLGFWVDRLRVSAFWASKDDKTEAATWWRMLEGRLTKIEDILRCDYTEHTDFDD
jgi:hypothetical protein